MQVKMSLFNRVQIEKQSCKKKYSQVELRCPFTNDEATRFLLEDAKTIYRTKSNDHKCKYKEIDGGENNSLSNLGIVICRIVGIISERHEINRACLGHDFKPLTRSNSSVIHALYGIAFINDVRMKLGQDEPECPSFIQAIEYMKVLII